MVEGSNAAVLRTLRLLISVGTGDGIPPGTTASAVKAQVSAGHLAYTADGVRLTEAGDAVVRTVERAFLSATLKMPAPKAEGQDRG